MSARPNGSRSLPPQPTTFVGRDAELAELRGLLADPSCRLVTLVGPGGSGKTRLAIEAAAHHQAAFAHGVVFVPLQDVPRAEDVPAKIGSAAGYSLAGQDEPRVQLLQRIRDRHLLLVLDNFEHLVVVAELLSELLAAAPSLKLLVTSRQTLNLQEEWRYPLAGLPVPGADAENPESFDAVRLFVERGRRRRPSLSLPQEQDAIVRICRLVEGMPLAIELAAAWTETLSSAAIAAEIERDRSLLTTRLRNVPERHRSMRAVFDHSWRSLAPAEQAVFRRLAVFRGGFRREAAESIAGATLPILASLFGRSLLRHEADGRYHLHELLRQYGWEQLESHPEELDAIRDRHSRYYLAHAAAQIEGLTGGRQREMLATVGAELENIRAAWTWAVEREDAETIGPAVVPTACFFQLRGRYREGLDVLETAISSLRCPQPELVVGRALAILLTSAGYLMIRVGRLHQAREAFVEARERHRELAVPFPIGLGTDPEIGLGIVALVEGDYAAAAQFGESARQRAEQQVLPCNAPYAWYLLTQAALNEGRYEAAGQAAQEAEAAARSAHDEWFLAYILNDLGTVAAVAGDHKKAREHFQASYAIREGFDDPGGMAVALVHLGKIALARGEHTEARALYERARKLYERSGDRGGIAAALRGLGLVAAREGKPQEARAHFAEALQITRETQFAPLKIAVVVDIVECLLQTDRADDAVEALAVAWRHPMADRETRERAERLLDRAPINSASARAKDEIDLEELDDLERLAGRLIADLAACNEPVSLSLQIQRDEGEQRATTLADPLTERESAVLRLVAAGRSNQQIADELFLAVSTVKWHTGQIFGKLQVRNRTQAVARARELGLLA